ncbi:MAG: carbohydrate porin [Bacteroidota bacterium]
MKICTLMIGAMIFSTAIAKTVTGQTKDTIREDVFELQRQIDSLKIVVGDLNYDLQNMKDDVVTTQQKSEKYFEFLEDKTDDDIQLIGDQRSKNKRVDDLLRAIREKPGQLRFNGSATLRMQSPSKNIQNKSAAVGSFDIFAMTSFGKGTLLFFDIESIGGDGPDQYFPTYLGLNGDAGTTQGSDGLDHLHLLEGWAEFSVFDNLFTITAGKIDLTNYFDNNSIANDETLQFLSGAFINNASFATTVPSNSPGMRIQTTLFEKYYFQFGLSSIDNMGKAILSDLFKTASLRFRLFANSSWETNFRFYGYQSPVANDAQGYGTSIDGMFFEKYNVFIRYGNNNYNLDVSSGISESWSAGFSFLQNFSNRGINFGVAYGEVIPFDGALNNEKQFEAYARYRFNEWVYVSPHFQWVFDAMGSDTNYKVFGFRTHFNF